MEEEQKQILKDVFGDSSDTEEEEEDQLQFVNFNKVDSSPKHKEIKNPKWEPIKEIKGLWLCREFLSTEQQSSLISSMENEGWFAGASHNQAMRFGDIPTWATKLSGCIHEAVCLGKQVSKCGDLENCDMDKVDDWLLPLHLLEREPLFDQLIANVYQPGEGICAHVDLMRFEDGIAIVSLESTCVMHFTRAERETCSIENGEEKDPLAIKIPILLTPGSLILMHGEARYCWKHEINRKPGFQVWGGQEINQQKRTSVTLRKLSQSK